MRNKLKDEDKRKNLSVTINRKLYILLNEKSEDLGINKSKLIEDLLKKYLEDEGVETDNIF